MRFASPAVTVGSVPSSFRMPLPYGRGSVDEHLTSGTDMAAKILAFAGSTRKESFNVRLLHIAAEGAKAAGAEVTVLDLKDFPLPMFDQDLEAEQGLPEPGKKLRELFLQ